MPKEKPVIIYYYRGPIERLYLRGGKWIDGYSENGPFGEVRYPWCGKRECQADAKARGCRAVFSATDGGARMRKRLGVSISVVRKVGIVTHSVKM